MNPQEYSNWVKIKKTFEELGNTDNYFYIRACAIVDGKPDPIVNLSNDK